MAKLDWQKRLNGLIRMHADGAYTDGELIHAVIMLFDGGDESLNELLWLELPELARKEILKLIKEIDDNTEFLAPAHSDGDELTKARYVLLKKWLMSNFLFR